jgi:hypothetical protein
VALGFIEVTRKGAAGNADHRQAAMYLLTYRPFGSAQYRINGWRRIAQPVKRHVRHVRHRSQKVRQPSEGRSLKAMSLRDAVISAAAPVGLEVDPNAEDGLESFLADVARKDRKSFVTLLNRAMALQPVRVPLPPIEKPADLVAASSEIARAVGEGEISPGDAASISTIVGNAGRAIELHQLAERIERIEAQAEQAAQK